MPEYHVADRDRAATLDALATARYNEGADTGENANTYVFSTLTWPPCSSSSASAGTSRCGRYGCACRHCPSAV